MHTKEPWSRGQLLNTAITRTWSKEAREAAEEEERQYVFANFSPSDEGRGRKLIARVFPGHDFEDNHRLITAAPNLLFAVNAAISVINPVREIDFTVLEILRSARKIATRGRK